MAGDIATEVFIAGTVRG